MNRTYSFNDIPVGYPFLVGGFSVTKQANGFLQVEGEGDVVDFFEIMSLTPDHDTGRVRDIHTVDLATVMGSLGGVYLVKQSDGFTIDQYDETGTLHYSQYFTQAGAAGRQFAKQTLGTLSELL